MPRDMFVVERFPGGELWRIILDNFRVQGLVFGRESQGE